MNELKRTKRKYSFYNKQFETERRSPKNKDLRKVKSQSKGLTFVHLNPISLNVTQSSLGIETKNMVHRSESYFSGDVLDTEDDYKMYLTETIESLLSRKIKRTRLLFKYDALQPKNNIHNYIDNIPNFILVAKTEQGYHLAAFSEAALSSRINEQGKSFIMSLTNRKYFTLFSGKKGIRYDNFYLIFGNNELTVQAKQRKIFSNFGINNACFDSRKEGVEVILGEGKQREVMALTFQVHQILLE